MLKKDDKTKHDKEFEDLRVKCAEYLDGWKRASADYQNLVKETAKSRREYVNYANENLILEMLPILDNFKLAFNQIPESEKNSAWVAGFQHIKKQLEELLKGNGCEEIKTVGHLFNPLEHEAIEQVNTEAHADNAVVLEKRPGYKLNNKVVQAAKVVVNMRDKGDTCDESDRGDIENKLPKEENEDKSKT
ncbi:MAG: nucleotide exchange factor GrpE [Parcubacteria group bacterium]